MSGINKPLHLSFNPAASPMVPLLGRLTQNRCCDVILVGLLGITSHFHRWHHSSCTCSEFV